jgi:hypothetical protein
MALPATGTQLSINQVQTYYGVASGTQKSLSALGNTHLGISLGTTLGLSASFGGQP